MSLPICYLRITLSSDALEIQILKAPPSKAIINKQIKLHIAASHEILPEHSIFKPLSRDSWMSLPKTQWMPYLPLDVQFLLSPYIAPMSPIKQQEPVLMETYCVFSVRQEAKLYVIM
jgi:hypothetical protein